MKDDKKSSIIKDALTDYNAIREAADANAKKKLAEEFPDKFNNILKEELNKNKSAKESYKKLDEAKESEKSDNIESNKESVMKKEEKETKKVEETAGKGKPFDKAAKKIETVEEDVKITDTVGKGDPFKEKAKGVKKIEEGEKDFVGDVESKTPNIGKGEAEDGVAFKEKIKGPSSGKPMPNLTEEFDITELDMNSVGTALEGAGEDDEVITMNQIEEEIASMEGLGEELNAAQPSGGDAYSKLMEMKGQLDEILQGMGEMHAAGGEQRFGKPEQVAQLHQGNPLIDEKGLEEMHAAGGEQRFGTSGQVAQLHQGNPLIDEKQVTDEEVDAVLGSGEQPVEETMAMPHPNQRVTTATIPGKEYKSQSAVNNMRVGVQESDKKISTLIEENKKLTKKLNETKKYKQSVTTLVEQYRTALDKYRNQLKEMATFNTNLAHVNNLLVNESLALTQEDKVKIINEFKKVDSIVESQKKYKAILTEMQGSKKTLTESLEKKVSTSIQPSSKQKLDEVVEKTAYENNEHINKMKKLIEYVENRGKKIIK